MGNKKSSLKKVKKESIVLLAGLQGAGKTSVLYKLSQKKGKNLDEPAPTVGYNTRKVIWKRTMMELWEFGNSSVMRDSKIRLLPLVNGLVFVVDSADPGTISEALAELRNLIQTLSHESRAEEPQPPLLILCNKQDVQNAISVDEIDSLMIASGLSQSISQWKAVPTSAIHGTGLDDGFTWLSSNMKRSTDSTSSKRRDSSFI